MQGYLNAARGGSKKASGARGLRLVINPRRLQLDDRTIVFKFTGNGGWVCASLGTGAEYMRAAKEDLALRRRIDAHTESLLQHRRALDRDLAQVIAAVELAKDYDPNQPRDSDGRWTSESGAAGAAVGATADAFSLYGSQSALQGLRALASRALGAAAALLTEGAAATGVAAAGSAAVLGTLFLPTNRGSVSAGTLPDAPEFSYKYDQDTGKLTVTQQNDDGTSDVVFSGHHDTDGVFRDDQGNAIGRYLGGDSVALDADAVRGYEARQRSAAQAPPGAVAQPDTTTRSDPEVCPEPGPDQPGRKDPGDIAYQMFVQRTVNGIPLGQGLAIRMIRSNGNPTYFDDCDYTIEMGALIDAKGFGYLRLLQQGADRYPWIGALQKLIDQAGRQIDAAQGRPIRWYFAEPQVGAVVRGVFQRLQIPIRIIDLPPPKGLIGDLKRMFEGNFP